MSGITTDNISDTRQTPAATGVRTFAHVLVNTMLANVTTSYLWFALTFWVYLETRSVLASAIVGGLYMIFIALFAILFGTVVDRHRKHRVMVLASVVTLTAFGTAGGLFLVFPESALVDFGAPAFWLFAGVILFGAVVENMRNIALSTTVTLLVPEERHANANGMVGTVQGLAFVVTSVFSGLSVGLLGMGWTLVIAIALTGIALVHLATLRIPEKRPRADEGRAPSIDLRGSIQAIRRAPGLFPLILFSTLNNVIGGVYMALADPYGLELFSVEMWGVVFGIASTGFVLGGLFVAKFGLGKNPIRTLLLVVVAMGLVGAFFALRDWWWLYAGGMFLYMAFIPIVEAAEHTVIQKVVPFERQGRVFGFAQALESAAMPITAFLIAPIAEFFVIPFMESAQGASAWGWLLGSGEARGIALVFVFAGTATVLLALVSFLTRAYRRVSSLFQGAEDVAATAIAGVRVDRSETVSIASPADIAA